MWLGQEAGDLRIREMERQIAIWTHLAIAEELVLVAKSRHRGLGFGNVDELHGDLARIAARAQIARLALHRAIVSLNVLHEGKLTPLLHEFYARPNQSAVVRKVIDQPSAGSLDGGEPLGLDRSDELQNEQPLALSIREDGFVTPLHGPSGENQLVPFRMDLDLFMPGFRLDTEYLDESLWQIDDREGPVLGDCTPVHAVESLGRNDMVANGRTVHEGFGSDRNFHARVSRE